jgi:DNA-binding NarL/FixJ family response regulator
MNGPVRALIAEDHPLFREALRATLTTAGITVVGAVDNGADAVDLARAELPDVAVLDLSMPGGGGLAATARITAEALPVRVLVLTSYDGDEHVYGALRAGARGYLLKTSGPEEIVRAVESLATGDGVFAASVVGRIHRQVSGPGRRADASPFPDLTARELEVLELMARGWGNPRIADHFVLSLKTVRNYVSSIYTKLGVQTRAAAIARARDAGLGHRDPAGGG